MHFTSTKLHFLDTNVKNMHFGRGKLHFSDGNADFGSIFAATFGFYRNETQIHAARAGIESGAPILQIAATVVSIDIAEKSIYAANGI